MQPTRYYVEAILKALRKKPERFEELLTNTRALLKRRGHERLYRKILENLVRKIAEGSERHGATLTVAREADAKQYEAELQKKARELGVEGELAVRTDPDLVGGYQLRAGSHFIDASFRRSLVTLFEKLKA